MGNPKFHHFLLALPLSRPAILALDTNFRDARLGHRSPALVTFDARPLDTRPPRPLTSSSPDGRRKMVSNSQTHIASPLDMGHSFRQPITDPSGSCNDGETEPGYLPVFSENHPAGLRSRVGHLERTMGEHDTSLVGIRLSDHGGYRK